MAGLGPDDYGYALHSNEALYRLVQERRFRFLLCGHTHTRMVRTIEDLTVINAGTLYREHRPCFLLADFEKKEAQFFDIHQDLSITPAETFTLPQPNETL